MYFRIKYLTINRNILGKIFFKTFKIKKSIVKQDMKVFLVLCVFLQRCKKNLGFPNSNLLEDNEATKL